MKEWVKFLIICLVLGYGLTSIAVALVYYVALQCESLDGTTNLAQITPWYAWAGITASVGLASTYFTMGKLISQSEG